MCLLTLKARRCFANTGSFRILQQTRSVDGLPLGSLTLSDLVQCSLSSHSAFWILTVFSDNSKCCILVIFNFCQSGSHAIPTFTMRGGLKGISYPLMHIFTFTKKLKSVIVIL